MPPSHASALACMLAQVFGGARQLLRRPGQPAGAAWDARPLPHTPHPFCLTTPSPVVLLPHMPHTSAATAAATEGPTASVPLHVCVSADLDVGVRIGGWSGGTTEGGPQQEGTVHLLVAVRGQYLPTRVEPLGAVDGKAHTLQCLPTCMEPLGDVDVEAHALQVCRAVMQRWRHPLQGPWGWPFTAGMLPARAPQVCRAVMQR
eukprot:1159127-Pelagomonas_calceolata.AAC.1